MSDNKRDYLYAIYGKSTFVKIKPALGIGKILFAFVDRDKKINIDCYINLLDYEELLDQIKTRYFQKKIEVEKAKGDKYPKAVWETPLGGSTKNNKTIYRKFSIAPGASQYAVFTAESGPAIDSDGKCVPVKKTPQNQDEFKTIRVGVMNYEELRKMMFESEKYLKVWYEFVQNKKLFDELNQMMQRPSNNENLLESTETETPNCEEPANTLQQSAFIQSDNTSNNPPSSQTAESSKSGDLTKGFFRSKNYISNMKNGKYLYVCRKTDEKPIPLVFLTDCIEKVDKSKWERFLKETSEKTEVFFSAIYTEKDGRLYFANFAA